MQLKRTHTAAQIVGPNANSDEAFRRQRLEILGMLAGGVAHDFNNALEVIMGFASLARMRLKESDALHEPLKIIEDSAHSAAGLSRQLLEITREDRPEPQAINVAGLLDGVLKIITRTFDRKIRIEHHIPSGLPAVQGFAARLQQAMLNLCLNARDGMNGAGVLSVEAEAITLAECRNTLPPGDYVRIAVRDSGAGIPNDVLHRIFEPFFTTKENEGGSGLGLAMVDRVIKEMGGSIAVKSAPEEGTEFVLYLPAIAEAAPTADPAPCYLRTGRGTVLVVDDEPRVLEFLEKGLTRLGYKVLLAEDGARACKLYAHLSSEISCVLLDMILPEMSGIEVYAHLRQINPSVRVILSSGYSSGRVPGNTIESGEAEFLGKPYTLEALSQALERKN